MSRCDKQSSPNNFLMDRQPPNSISIQHCLIYLFHCFYNFESNNNITTTQKQYINSTMSNSTTSLTRGPGDSPLDSDWKVSFPTKNISTKDFDSVSTASLSSDEDSAPDSVFSVRAMTANMEQMKAALEAERKAFEKEKERFQKEKEAFQKEKEHFELERRNAKYEIPGESQELLTLQLQLGSVRFEASNARKKLKKAEEKAKREKYELCKTNGLLQTELDIEKKKTEAFKKRYREIETAHHKIKSDRENYELTIKETIKQLDAITTYDEPYGGCGVGQFIMLISSISDRRECRQIKNMLERVVKDPQSYVRDYLSKDPTRRILDDRTCITDGETLFNNFDDDLLTDGESLFTGIDDDISKLYAI